MSVVEASFVIGRTIATQSDRANAQRMFRSRCKRAAPLKTRGGMSDPWDMTAAMELRRRTWSAAVRLAVVASVIAVAILVVATHIGGLPDAAVALPLVVASFGASWVQTARVRRQVLAAHGVHHGLAAQDAAAHTTRSHVRPLMAPPLGPVTASTH
jgi:hypothetical protein